MQRFVCSQRLALRTVRMSASTYLYVPQRKDESVLKACIKEITDTPCSVRQPHFRLIQERGGDVRTCVRCEDSAGTVLQTRESTCACGFCKRGETGGTQTTNFLFAWIASVSVW